MTQRFPYILCGLLLILLTGSSWGHHALASNKPPAAIPHQGNIYYVAPGGDDGNMGTIDYPWQTIQHAADTLVAGDTVYIRAGTYPEQVVPQNSGTAGQEIVYAAYPVEVVTIDGAALTVPQYEGLFYIAGRDYIRVSGLRVVNSNEAGILADGCSHLTLSNNSTYNTSSSGIGVWSCDNVVVAGNRVEKACTGIWQECLTIAGTDTFAVYDNEVLDCGKEGLDAKDGASNGQIYRNHVHHTQAVGIYVDAFDKYTHDIAVFQNVVHDVQDNDGFSIGSEQGGVLENVWVYNNIAYNNRYLGLTLHNCCEGPAAHPVRNITIVNNTFANNGLDPWGGGIAVDNPDLENVTIRNNIVSQNLSFQIVVSVGVPTATLTIDHNLVDGFRGDVGEVYGDAYVEGDPQFVDPAGADFHLRGDSPAIDQGSAVGAPDDDYDGQARPAGLGYDIGADEYMALNYHTFLPLALRGAAPPPGLSAVNDFLYQLQNLDLEAVGATAYDLVVMDYSSDGGPAGEFSAADIAALQNSPGGSKVIVAYMSIGEAETYRFYWDPGWDADNDGIPGPGAPSWLDIENPDWPGNYKVRYWDPGWQAIVFQYADRLLNASFDGAYLDIIDAYEYYAEQGRTTAAQEMANFVAALRAYVRGVDPDFTIIPQNGTELVTLVPAYMGALDGIGQEDIYYGYESDNEPTAPTVTAELESYLDLYVAAGKLVLTIDYADYRVVPAYVDDAYTRAQTQGYVPFCTVRELDELIVNPGHEPN